MFVPGAYCTVVIRSNVPVQILEAFCGWNKLNYQCASSIPDRTVGKEAMFH